MAAKRKPLDLMSYAASPSNPPKGYKSLEIGLKAGKLRGDLFRQYIGEGLSLEDAATRADAAVVGTYGKPS